jgi:CRP-like cAMP-binding protein
MESYIWMRFSDMYATAHTQCKRPTLIGKNILSNLKISCPGTFLYHESEEHSLASVLIHIILGASKEETEILNRLEDQRYHEEIDVNAGEMIFQKETHSDSFFVVLKGCVANSTPTAYKAQRQQQEVLSGAGIVKPKHKGRSSHAHGAATLWPVGGVFGYLDFLLERPTSFRTIATLDGTRVARFTHSHINLSQAEDPELHALLQRVLLHISSRNNLAKLINVNGSS